MINHEYLSKLNVALFKLITVSDNFLLIGKRLNLWSASTDTKTYFMLRDKLNGFML